MKPFRLLALSAVLAVVSAVTVPARAADLPPLRILVGYAAGGGSDMLARVLADELRVSLNRPVVVENKLGAGGRIAAELLKNSPPDGNTVMVAPNGLTSIQAIVYKTELRYDPATDLLPVAKLVNNPIAIAVSSATKVQTAAQLAAWAKANPNAANFGSPAAGGLPHFVGLLTGKVMGTPWTHVAYKGGAPVALALMGNEIAMGVTTIETFLPQESAGKLKIIGITGAKRSALAPHVPTMLEQGFNVKADGWSAMWAGPGTSAAQINTISAAVKKALENPTVQTKLAAGSMDADYMAPADLGALQKAEWAMWMPIVEASGFKPDN